MSDSTDAIANTAKDTEHASCHIHRRFLPNEDDEIGEERREPDDSADAGDCPCGARIPEVESKDSD